MSLAARVIDAFLHLDKYMGVIIDQYGVWTYILIFLIIFSETGLVVAPFLPGDSLLFTVGAFAALDVLRIEVLLPLLTLAAILGDSANYAVGRRLGTKVFESPSYQRWFKPEHLQMTREFYDRHGGKTIILARFLPIIRTLAPFVAGVGQMNYRLFFIYNVVGGIIWVFLFTLAGYLFGNIPAIKERFGLVVLAIVVLSVAPTLAEYIRRRFKKNRPV